ncbi:MAG: alpha/beta hydrolase [Actinomycetia bacterium]|nr:alpha/beta hydrolase [Actinomycetes bacterium]
MDCDRGTRAVEPARVRIVDGRGRPLALAVERWGNGRPLVLLHGMGSWRAIWRDFCPPYACVALDLPGFGDSDLPRERQDLSDYAVSVARAIEALGLPERPALVGHSFGAMVAVQAAARYRAAAALLLVAPAGFVEPVGALSPTPWPLLNRLLIYLTSGDWFGRRMAEGLGLVPDRLSSAQREALRRGWRRAREMARMGRFYRYPEMARDVARLSVPVHVVAGDRDPLFPVARLAPALAGVAVTWLPGVGHVPMLQDPEGFGAVATAILGRLYPPA